jgi:hypothetical protein
MPIKDPNHRGEYFRDLTRERRAGIEPDSKPEPESDHAAIDSDIAHWIKYLRRHRPVWADKVLDAIKGLDPRTEEGRRELAHIYQAAQQGARDARKGKREEEAWQEAEETELREVPIEDLMKDERIVALARQLRDVLIELRTGLRTVAAKRDIAPEAADRRLREIMELVLRTLS